MIELKFAYSNYKGSKRQVKVSQKFSRLHEWLQTKFAIKSVNRHKWMKFTLQVKQGPLNSIIKLKFPYSNYRGWKLSSKTPHQPFHDTQRRSSRLLSNKSARRDHRYNIGVNRRRRKSTPPDCQFESTCGSPTRLIIDAAPLKSTKWMSTQPTQRCRFHKFF